jgi:hypothetical protein
MVLQWVCSIRSRRVPTDNVGHGVPLRSERTFIPKNDAVEFALFTGVDVDRIVYEAAVTGLGEPPG